MQTEKYAAVLQAKQQELMKRINAIKGDFAQGRSADFAEQASESENDDVLHGIEAEAAMELSQVNLALQRIKQDEYGICESCGEAISEARLTAVPYASQCIKCAN